MACIVARDLHSGIFESVMLDPRFGIPDDGGELGLFLSNSTKDCPIPEEKDDSLELGFEDGCEGGGVIRSVSNTALLFDKERKPERLWVKMGLTGVMQGEIGGEEGNLNALLNANGGVGDLVEINEAGGATLAFL